MILYCTLHLLQHLGSLFLLLFHEIIPFPPNMTGQRTVGSWSHIAAVVDYLSYARYLSKIFKPAEMLTISDVESDSDND